MALGVMPTNRRPRSVPAPEAPAASPAARLPTLVAPRLQLRWMEAADLEALFAVYSDPEVVRYWSHTEWQHRDEAHIYLEAIQRGEKAAYYLFDEGVTTMLARSKAMGMDLQPHIESGMMQATPPASA